jgi:dephospho-CoA kinase
MFRIALIGGIGSGKTEVASRLLELGAHVIEADRVARDIVAPGSATLGMIARAFGPSVIRADGTLNREALAAAAFSSEEGLELLNQITWPPLKDAIIVETERLEREYPAGVLVVDAALLLKWDMLDLFDLVVAVTSPEKARIERLVASGKSEKDARARMRAQAPETELVEAADYVIENNGSLAELRAAVGRLWCSLPLEFREGYDERDDAHA